MSQGHGSLAQSRLRHCAFHPHQRLEQGRCFLTLALHDGLGHQGSGLGRALSRLGLNAFRQSKMVMLDPKAELQSWWYPYSDEFYAERGGRWS